MFRLGMFFFNRDFIEFPTTMKQTSFNAIRALSFEMTREIVLMRNYFYLIHSIVSTTKVDHVWT